MSSVHSTLKNGKKLAKNEAKPDAELMDEFSQRVISMHCLMNSDVVREQKSGSGLGSAFRVQVRFRDQHFRDILFGVSGVFKVKSKID